MLFDITLNILYLYSSLQKKFLFLQMVFVKVLITAYKENLCFCVMVFYFQLYLSTFQVDRLFHAHKCKFRPYHKQNLANEFACYVNYEASIL